MNKLEVLMNEKKHITSICLEKDTSLYGTKQRIIDYSEALKMKDKNARLREVLSSSFILSILPLLFTFLIYKSNFSGFFFDSVNVYFNVNKCIIGLSIFAGIVKTSINYINDLKEYKNHGKRYNDLTFFELKEKVVDLKKTQKELEADLEKLKPILNYLKTEVEKEEEKHRKERAKLIEISDMKFDYKNVHLNEYEIPKVKVKRRDENDTKAKRYI